MGSSTPKDWQEPYRQMSDGDFLNCIRNGDELATNYLMETYLPLLQQVARMKLVGKPQLEEPDVYAHDAIVLLWTRARNEGAAVLKHEYSTIRAWLPKAVDFLIRNADRYHQKHWRDKGQSGNEDAVAESVFAQIPDPDAASFVDKPEKEVFAVVEEVLAQYPKELEPLKTLVQNYVLAGIPWKEIAQIMTSLYPANKPPFELSYLQRTYWDRIHKNPFYQKLRDALRGYGYDF